MQWLSEFANRGKTGNNKIESILGVSYQTEFLVATELFFSFVYYVVRMSCNMWNNYFSKLREAAKNSQGGGKLVRPSAAHVSSHIFSFT